MECNLNYIWRMTLIPQKLFFSAVQRWCYFEAISSITHPQKIRYYFYDWMQDEIVTRIYNLVMNECMKYNEADGAAAVLGIPSYRENGTSLLATYSYSTVPWYLCIYDTKPASKTMAF